MSRRVVHSGDADLPPVLASVHGSPDDRRVFRLEAVGFAGDRHVIMVTAGGDALPSDPELRPAFAATILDALIVSAAASASGGSAGLPQTSLTLGPELDATWVASA